jgi:hypothetical protein
MGLVDRVIELLGQVREDDVLSLPPAQRQRLAELLRYLAGIAERPELPSSGVLKDLDNGERGEE